MLKGVTASDAIGAVVPAATANALANAASKIMSAISGGATPPAPTSPATGTKLKIALATPELTAFRKRGKTTAKNCGVAATPQSSKTDFNAERDKVVKEISLAAGFDGNKEISIAVTPNLKGVPDHRNVSEGDFDKSLNNVWDVAWQEGARGACPVQMYVFPHCCYSADAVSRLQG